MGNLSLIEEDDFLTRPLSQEAKKIALRDLREDEHTKTLALKQLREWIQANPNIIKCRTDSNFLLRFLRMKKFRMTETQLLLEKYLRMRQENPGWFWNLDILNARLEGIIDRGYFFALPQRDDCGRRVFFSVTGGVDPSKDTASDMAKAVQVGLESLIEDEENQVRGFCYILDLKNVGLSVVTLWTPGEVSKALHCTEKTIPMRHKEVHFVHLPLTLYAIFEFAKTLLSDKIKKRFQVHNDVDHLIKRVPTRILPREYGGEMPLADMISCYKKELVKVRQKVLNLDDMRYEVSCKHKKLQRTLGSLQKSISRLEID